MKILRIDLNEDQASELCGALLHYIQTGTKGAIKSRREALYILGRIVEVSHGRKLTPDELLSMGTEA